MNNSTVADAIDDLDDIEELTAEEKRNVKKSDKIKEPFRKEAEEKKETICYGGRKFRDVSQFIFEKKTCKRSNECKICTVKR